MQGVHRDTGQTATDMLTHLPVLFSNIFTVSVPCLRAGLKREKSLGLVFQDPE